MDTKRDTKQAKKKQTQGGTPLLTSAFTKSARPASARLGTARPSTAIRGSTRLDSARPSSARPSTATRGSITWASSKQTTTTPASAKQSTTRQASAIKTTATKLVPKPQVSSGQGNPPNDPPYTRPTLVFECENSPELDECDKPANNDKPLFQQIIEQIIEEILADPMKLPPIDHLLIQALVSFVIDGIVEHLKNKKMMNGKLTSQQEKMLKFASNATISSALTNKGITPVTLIIKYNMKRYLEGKGIIPISALVKTQFVTVLKRVDSMIRTVVDTYLPDI